MSRRLVADRRLQWGTPWVSHHHRPIGSRVDGGRHRFPSAKAVPGSTAATPIAGTPLASDDRPRVSARRSDLIGISAPTVSAKPSRRLVALGLADARCIATLRRSLVRIVATAAVATFALLATPAADPADAATLPAAVEANLDSVFAFLEAGGLPNGRERVECDATCQYLLVKSFPPPSSPSRPMANPSALRNVGSQLYRLRTAVGELPGPAKLGIAGAPGGERRCLA